METQLAWSTTRKHLCLRFRERYATADGLQAKVRERERERGRGGERGRVDGGGKGGGQGKTQSAKPVTTPLLPSLTLLLF